MARTRNAMVSVPAGTETEAALGLLLIALGGRCPHCGKILFFLPANANQCPKCHGPL